MDMTGEFRIAAPRERVWQALNDPEILKQCIPGCETVEKVSDTEFTAKVVAKVGPVRANFAGKVTLSDLDPPKAYTIAGEGSGGVAGFAKGSAKVDLDEDGGETVLHYQVQAHVGGKLAQIGSRLIDATSRKMASDFFERFVAAMSPPDAANEDSVSPPPDGGGSTVARVADVAVASQPETTSKTAAVSGRLPPVVWVTGLTAIVALILYYFTRNGGVR